MAKYVQKGKMPPPELVIGLDWERFKTPYIAGGLRDQPIRMFGRIKTAMSVYSALVEWKYKYTPTPESEERWHKTHEWVVDIVSRVNALQKEK